MLPGCQSVRDGLNLSNEDDTPLLPAYLPPWKPGAPRLLLNLPKGSQVKMDPGTDYTVYYVTDQITADRMGILWATAPTFSANGAAWPNPTTVKT